MKKTLKDVKVIYDEPIPILCDNTIASNISKNLVMHLGTKHISISYHFLREKVVDPEVKLEYVPIEDQGANIFIKEFSKDTLEYLMQKLGVVTPLSN